MERTIYEGTLEIDHTNGVLYFRTYDKVTVLRISHLKKPTPHDEMIDIAAVGNLTSYVPFSGALVIGRVEPNDAPGYIPSVSEFLATKRQERCQVCGKNHDDTNTVEVRIKDGTKGFLYVQHEYMVAAQSAVQRYPREWRVGFMGTGIGGLQFSARGPDRSHSGKYGGTVTLDQRDIIKFKEVEHDIKLRHVGQRNLASETRDKQ